jgi:hypothetical protein
MSDQLFWIISVLLVVEILSQLFQFETIGKIFIQFYMIVVTALIGITLASFDTRQLVNYFVYLIAFINGLRFLLYKINSIRESGLIRFTVDIITLSLLLVLMWVIDPYLSFDRVPGFSTPMQIGVLSGLGLTLLYEMLQRSNQVGISLDDFWPQSFLSFVIVFSAIVSGLVLILSEFVGISMTNKYVFMGIYVLFFMLIKGIVNLRSRDPEFYDLLYVIPTFVIFIMFVQLIIIGG